MENMFCYLIWPDTGLKEMVRRNKEGPRPILCSCPHTRTGGICSAPAMSAYRPYMDYHSDTPVDFNHRWIETRRGGGGGGDPIAKPLSVLLLILAGLAVIAKLSRQSNVNAALLAGNIFGYFVLPVKVEFSETFCDEFQATFVALKLEIILCNACICIVHI